jgi:hypothetical protein
MKNSELCVPEGALAEAGEGGNSIAPAVGDTVEMTLSGRVTRLENGEVYVKPETANGQPLEDEGSEEMDLESEEKSLKSLGDGGGMGGALMALMLLVLLAFAEGAQAQTYGQALRYSKQYNTTVVATNTHPASITPTAVHYIGVENSSATALWVWVGDTNVLAVPANGNIPAVAPKLVAAGGNAEYFFGPGGMPMRFGCVVATSTTDRTLTNSTASFVVTVVHSPIQ